MRFFTRALTGLFLFSISVALLAVAVWTVVGAVQERQANDSRNAPHRERVYAAHVIPYETGTIAPTLTVFGEVRSRRTLELRTAVAGRVIDLSPALIEGGVVSEGDLLLRIDPADAMSSREVAAANLRQSQAELRDAEAGVELAQADLNAATAQAVLQSNSLQRQQDLLDRGASTTAAVEAAEMSATSAEQSVVSRRLALAQAETRRFLALTTLERDRIELADAERELRETEIRAEFDGVLTDVTASTGRLLAQNEQIATLIDPNALEVSFRVSTAQYARLLNGSGALPNLPATVSLDVLGHDIQALATLTREAGSVQTGQSGRLIFADLHEPGGLRTGDFVSVEITEAELHNVAALPVTVLDNNGNVLALTAESRLEAVPVTVLRNQRDEILIRAPALEGRELVQRVTPILGAGVLLNPIRPEANNQSAQSEENVADEMLALDPERRARLIRYVETSAAMPTEMRERVLQTLSEQEVPAQMVRRLESRMGG